VGIESFRHKPLKRLFLDDDPKGLPSDCVEKLRAMLTFLQDMRRPETLVAFPRWRAHQVGELTKLEGSQLTGGRKGMWSLHVTRNWRLTFPHRGRPNRRH
jgi:proteic killer suppression protein